MTEKEILEIVRDVTHKQRFLTGRLASVDTMPNCNINEMLRWNTTAMHCIRCIVDINIVDDAETAKKVIYDMWDVVYGSAPSVIQLEELEDMLGRLHLIRRRYGLEH